jgi:hypothetical protein
MERRRSQTERLRARGNQKGGKREQRNTKWVPKGDQREAKRGKGCLREPKGHPLWNRNEKVRKRVRGSMQIDAIRVPKWKQKWSKNTSKINPTNATEKIMKFMEILSSRNCKTKQIRWKGHQI